MATLKELALRTGYSPTTISRILTGDPSLSVSEEARRRVLEEAGELNYSATRSRRGRTPKLLLRVGLAEMLTPAQQLNDPFYLYLSSFVRQGCLDRRYACLPLEQHGAQFLPPDGDGVDGIIAIGTFTPAQIESLCAMSSNLVFLNSSPRESQFDSVVLNYSLGIALALDHLTGLGHRQIGFLGPLWKRNEWKQQVPEIRRQLFLTFLEQRGMSPALLLDCPMEAHGTARILGEYLSSGGPLPTALLAANEESALGAVHALHAAGYSIPEDLSLVSFNDTPPSALITPPLTSVSTHVDEMAYTALRLVGERAVLPGKTPIRTLPLKVVLPPSLTQRASTVFCQTK